MGDVSIRGSQVGVAQLALDDAVVYPLVRKMKGCCVSALMGVRSFTYTNPFTGSSENTPDITGVNLAAGPGSEYKLVGASLPYKLSQAYLDLFTNPYHPTLAALATLHREASHV